MPRENQKRGRRAKHKQDDIVKAPPKIKARLPSPVQQGAQPEETPAWPLLDPETRAYFEQIQTRILELENLGVGQDRPADDDLGEDDERVLLIRASLSSLAGHEIELATDADASFILERLLHSMDDFARRVLADRFTGQYPALAKDRFASHVLQSLFALGAQTIDRESRGIVAQRPTGGSSEDLPTMTAILSTATLELVPAVSTLLYDPYASHLLRYALLLITGAPFPSADDDRLRSKKSRKFKSGQAPLRSITQTDGDEGKGKARERVVPDELVQAKGALLEALDEALGRSTDGAAARQAASEGVACIVVQMLLNIEADEGRGDQQGSLLDRLLEGLVTKLASEPDEALERSSYVDTIMRETTSSHILETILSRSSDAVLAKLWSTYYLGRVAKLAGHPVANFTVARGIERLDATMLEATIAELAEAGSEAMRHLIEGSRTGTIKALLERCAALGVAEAELSELLQEALGTSDKKLKRYLVMALLGLSSYPLLSKISAHIDFSKPPEITMQGSLLAQAWLSLAAPYNEPVLESLLAVPVDYLVTLARHPMASRLLDCALTLPSIAGKYRRRLILRLLGHYHLLADDRIGSHVVDKAWAAADVYLKEKIAASLLDHLLVLQASRTGHFFARTAQLALFERRPAEWKAKMISAAAPPAPVPASAPEIAVVRSPAVADGAEGKKEKKRRKRREDEPDEVDAIFAAVAGPKRIRV